MSKAKNGAANRKPELRCFLSCDAVSQEGGPGKGKVSLHGLFDAVHAEEFPGLFKPFFLFARFVGGPRHPTITVHATGTDGKPFAQGTAVKVNPAKGDFRDVIMQVGVIPLAGFGKITFKLKIDGKPLGWPCEITVQKPPVAK